jgi:hypothetical protein
MLLHCRRRVSASTVVVSQQLGVATPAVSAQQKQRQLHQQRELFCGSSIGGSLSTSYLGCT